MNVKSSIIPKRNILIPKNLAKKYLPSISLVQQKLQKLKIMTTKTIIRILILNLFTINLSAQNWTLTPQQNIYNSNSGSVGVGTMTPSATLDVYGSGSSSFMGETGNIICNSKPVLRLTNNFSGGISESCPVPNIMELNTDIGTGLINKVSVDASGNMGIGDNIKPQSRLDVEGNITMRAGARPGYIPISDANGTMIWSDPAQAIASNVWALNQDTVYARGNNVAVGIGTSSPKKGYKLSVNGKVVCTELRVLEYKGWDRVFEDDYVLRPLSEVKTYIEENKHLPDIESATELEAEGIDLSAMNGLLLRKIEELTLYMIDLEEQVSELQAQINQ